MSIKDLARETKLGKARQEEDEREARANFRVRVAAQQFLKHHGPLLRAYAHLGGDSRAITHRGVFEKKAREARALAVAIAARVLGRDETSIGMEQARHFRSEAAEVVAKAWQDGVEIDVAAMAKSIAEAVSGADDVYDDEIIKWSQVSGNGSVTMTAAAAAMTLAGVVDIYDFRIGRRLVLNTLTSAILDATRDAVASMAPETATPEDRRSLSQTTMRTFADFMRQLYEDAARDALALLGPMEEKQRKAWLRTHKPLESVVARFRVWSTDIAQVAAAAARETALNAQSDQNGPST